MRVLSLSDEGNWVEYDMKKIVVIGSLNADFVVCTSALPREGQTVLGHSFDIFPGGKGANQSAALARLGAHVTHIGKVGMDDHARLLKDSHDIYLPGCRRDGKSKEGASGMILVEFYPCEQEVFLPSITRLNTRGYGRAAGI